MRDVCANGVQRYCVYATFHTLDMILMSALGGFTFLSLLFIFCWRNCTKFLHSVRCLFVCFYFFLRLRYLFDFENFHNILNFFALIVDVFRLTFWLKLKHIFAIFKLLHYVCSWAKQTFACCLLLFFFFAI